MARTQIKARNITNSDLTGASFAEELKLWNETISYNVGDRVIWQNNWFEAVNSTTGGIEGDLSNSPDRSNDWREVTNLMWNAYPGDSQTFSNTPVTLEFSIERVSDPGITLNAGEITFNVSGRFILFYEYSAVNTTSTRVASHGFLQLSIDGGSSWDVIPNTEVWSYNRESNHGESTGALAIPIEVNIGDMYRVQMMSASSTNVKTITSACNFSIFALTGAQGIQGIQGEKGDTGASGDINWTGDWDSNITYQENDAVYYLGSSYVSIANNNTETPSDTATNWDILASRGSDGSGTQITISNSGTNIPETPHGGLNFIGPLIIASDAGSNNTANIEVLPTKHKYMVPIWAEENAALADNTWEWAFGNGANTPGNDGISVFVPSGYDCKAVALSLNLHQGSAIVELIVNGSAVSQDISADAGAGNKSAAVEFSSPVAINNADRITFRTVSQNGTAGPNTVTVWLEYTEQ